ncbi:MAG TPA: hypothetical protein VMZ53_19205 [Kofleriaceae bacterium]|nr:hypothetical protein [Kofleriaceae bacterium]
MSFRNDLDAALARIDVLERENCELIAENTKLRGAESPHAPRTMRPSHRSDPEAASAHVALLERTNLQLADENRRLAVGAPPAIAEPAPRPWPYDDLRDLRIEKLGVSWNFHPVVGILILALALLMAWAFPR